MIIFFWKIGYPIFGFSDIQFSDIRFSDFRIYDFPIFRFSDIRFSDFRISHQPLDPPPLTPLPRHPQCLKTYRYFFKRSIALDFSDSTTGGQAPPDTPLALKKTPFFSPFLFFFLLKKIKRLDVGFGKKFQRAKREEIFKKTR